MSGTTSSTDACKCGRVEFPADPKKFLVDVDSAREFHFRPRAQARCRRWAGYEYVDFEPLPASVLPPADPSSGGAR